jgi:hypothetical protein
MDTSVYPINQCFPVFLYLEHCLLQFLNRGRSGVSGGGGGEHPRRDGNSITA